jgi:hypothetical protein
VSDEIGRSMAQVRWHGFATAPCRYYIIGARLSQLRNVSQASPELSADKGNDRSKPVELRISVRHIFKEMARAMAYGGMRDQI